MNPASIIHQTTIDNLSKTLGSILTEKHLTLSVAESCTGGMIGAALTEISGSSTYFSGGVIAYTNEIKHDILHVPQQILDTFGAVSSETVIAMAQGAKKLCKTECAIAVSGVAGPGGGSSEKPVGLVWIGIAIGRNVESFRFQFEGNRQSVRMQTVCKALHLLITHLSNAA